MKVYRVYEDYHSSSESGTTEYGIFTSKDKVREVLKKLYKKEKKDNNQVTLHLERMYIEKMDEEWNTCYIETKEYELDEEITNNIVGFT